MVCGRFIQPTVVFAATALLLFVFFPGAVAAQPGADSDRYPRAIEDNSFLVEEAYNQEPGVVQHISTLAIQRTPVPTASYGFTQEWPVFGQAHQFSYTLPYTRQGDGLGSGIGDVMLNYRYQLAGHDAWMTLAPRVSLILPSGDSEQGLGAGARGLQFNMPASKRLSAGLVVHMNAGATLLRGVRGTNSDGMPKRDLWSYNVGGSAIALLTPNLNLMLESVALFNSSLDELNRASLTKETIVSPGFRYAINRGGLQIVPGFAVPVSVTGPQRRVGAFFYVSFEHPLWAR